MTPLLNVPYGEDSSMNAFVIYSHGNSTLYLSSGILEYQDSDKYFNYIASSEQVIFGSHGKKYKERTYLKSFDGITKRMIFQSTNLFLTQEALMEQTEKGCEILSHPTKIELYCYD